MTVAEEVDETGSSPSPSKQGFYAAYEPREELGSGLTSVVRRCVEKATGLEFAVKIVDVSDERQSSEEAAELRRSTMREIDILRRLSGHEYVISLHDFYTTPTSLFAIFELCSAGELFDYMTQVVSLSEKKTRHIMKQLLRAVEAMHEMNIVHRDLKPENILMHNVEDCTIKVTDFGFAYELSKNEKLTELVGTPGYLSPELLRCSMYQDFNGYGLPTDLWACGVIMYTLLCGYAPFYHRKQMLMLRMISEGRYEFRSPEWDEISTQAKDLISLFLTKDPASRITASDALQHPFFCGINEPVPIAPVFEARRRFQLAIVQVRALVRIRHLKDYPLIIKFEDALENPYATRKMRKLIDGTAFQIYGHWVKKGRAGAQMRDLLFANTLKPGKTQYYRRASDGEAAKRKPTDSTV